MVVHPVQGAGGQVLELGSMENPKADVQWRSAFCRTKDDDSGVVHYVTEPGVLVVELILAGVAPDMPSSGSAGRWKADKSYRHDDARGYQPRSKGRSLAAYEDEDEDEDKGPSPY